MEEFAEPVRQSALMWFYNALGWRYLLALPLAALVAFVMTLVLVTRGKGSMTGAALVFIVPMPFLVGIFGAIDGTLMSFIVIAGSPETPKPSEIAQGISMLLVAPLVGMLLMVPSYLLAMLGLFFSALGRHRET